MNLDNILPLSKSWIAVFFKCPWRAWADKEFGLKQPESLTGNRGTGGHDGWQGVIAGLTSMDDTDAYLRENYDGEIAWLTRRAVEIDPPVPAGACREFEAHVCCGGPRYNNWLSHAFLDSLVVHPGLKQADTIDLKFTRAETDFPFERSNSVCCVKSMIPECEIITWTYLYPRSGHLVRWVYDWTDPGWLRVVGPDGSEHVYDGGKLLTDLESSIQQVAETDPTPTPGPHCQDWFGSGNPCVALGNGCPLGVDVPALLSETRPGTGVMGILRPFEDSSPVATAVEASQAYTLLTQAQAYLKQVESGIKEWSRVHGPFPVGGGSYGWDDKEVFEVDKTKALDILINRYGLSLADAAKGLNISDSSLKAFNRKKWGDLYDVLEKQAIFIKTTKPKFGVIEEDA